MFRNCFGLLSLFLAVGTTSFGAVDPQLLSLAPPSAEMIAGVDVESARNSDFGRFLMGRLTVDEQAIQRFAVATGFDIRRDLKSLIVASSGSADKDRPAVVVLGRGAFDESRIRAIAVGKGSVVQAYQGTDMFLPATGRGNAFAFVGPGTIAIGDQASIQQVISNRPALPIDPQLQQLIASVSGDNDIWFASRVPLSGLARRHMDEGSQSSFRGSQLLQTVETATGGIRFGDSLRMALTTVCRSEKDATALADVIRFGTDMVQMQSQSDQRSELISSALKSMQLSNQGTSVHLELTLPEASVEQLAEIAPNHRHPSR